MISIHPSRTLLAGAALAIAALSIGGAQLATRAQAKPEQNAPKANAPQPAPISTDNVVDMTHTLTHYIPYPPILDIHPFQMIPIATVKKDGSAANRWVVHEHIGTQIDSPAHFIADGITIDQMPVRNFIAPLAIIDISARAKTDPDTQVTIADIKNWEHKYGRLPKGAAVFMYSGWDTRMTSLKAFRNMDDKGVMHIPGIAASTAKFLIDERDVVGLGVDTFSIDVGKSKDFPTHKTWLGARKWNVEMVANMRKVPAAGATVFVGAPKVVGATGGLTRVIATFPSKNP